MDTMIHAHIPPGRADFSIKPYDYDPDSAHTVEVLREVNEIGELGSFGFTLNDEKPPIVGTVVPGKSQSGLLVSTVDPVVWFVACNG